MKVDSDTGFPRVAAWIAALAGFALTLLAFWPGYLSWDSAYQWAQARGAVELDPTHPPVMVRAWSLVRHVLPDPGGMLAVSAALWWAALAHFANALGGGATRRAATVLLIGAWPPLLAVLPHLWKDVWMAAFFALAVALLAADEQRRRDAPDRVPGIARLELAGAAICLACAFRLNALPAALPLVAWLAWRWSTPRADGTMPGMRRPLRRRPGRREWAISRGVGLVAQIWIVGLFLNAAPQARLVPTWPSIAMWDIAAVSIAEDELLFPPDWIDPALTVADLRRDFRPDVNVPSFAAGQLKLNYYFDYTPQQFAQLRAAWLALPTRHTRAYLGHRLRLSAFLFGLRQHEHDDGLVLAPGIVGFADNPPVARNDGALNRWLQPTLSALVDTPVFAGWVYLLVSLGLVARWLRRRDGGFAGLSAVVALSALALAAPLVLLSPSSDFRYLLWSVLATLLAGALAFARPSTSRQAATIRFQTT